MRQAQLLGRIARTSPGVLHIGSSMKLLGVILWLGTALAAGAAAPVELRVDFGQTNKLIRPLHGLNKGPIASGGMIDLTASWRELAPPLTRLHDCQWPYPEIVDMHAIFRVPGADPANPASYDWALTDSYLAAVRATGAGIVYRLGESIEHASVKRFVHPPADVQKWAEACVGIVRHYNEGWAGGAHHDIRYWEIWNEPENRPAMWSGTDEDYLRLYAAAAEAIKKHDASLKVGGPALGFSGTLEGGRFVPSAFLKQFLAFCRQRSLPLDFFSWHCYTADPAELTARARGVRQTLDEYGFSKTESHLNEWNYLPGNTWEPFSKEVKPQTRQQFYEEMAGAGGAAFLTTALIELQDAPVDVCNFYHGELGAFGLFNEFGVPNRSFHAMRAFAKMAALGCRLKAFGGAAGSIAVLAATNPAQSRSAILVSHFRGDSAEFLMKLQNLPQRAEFKVWVVDSEQVWKHQATRQLDGSAQQLIRLNLPAPALAFVELETAGKKP